MREFDYVQARSRDDVFTALATHPTARMLAGGTNLVDLMKEGVETPGVIVDINGLEELRRIDFGSDGTVLLGALVRNSEVAWHPGIRARFALVAEAILAGATTQLRNMATVGGNLLQRCRCPYFVQLDARCNKRDPGTGCDALDGASRMCAVLGTSDDCIAAFPSDLCVALTALDAVVHVESARGARRIAFADFHKQPGSTPWVENDLAHGELITAVEIPAPPPHARSGYRKLRDRTSYAFALVSVAAVVQLDGEVIRDLRLAFGGVGTVPWRAHRVESALRGQRPTPELLRDAAGAEFAQARSRPGNTFKIDLAQRAAVRVLQELTSA